MAIDAKATSSILMALWIWGCSDLPFSDDDPFEGIMPTAIGERPVQWLASDSAAAKGIWRIDGEPSGVPYNVTQITCYRDQMTCAVASAELVNYSSTSRFLDVNLYMAPITNWGTDELTYSSSGGCRRQSTTLSARDGSVVQRIETDLTLRTCQTDGQGNDAMGIPLLTEPRIVRMITTNEWQQRKDDGLE